MEKSQIPYLLQQIDQIIDQAKQLEQQLQPQLERIHPNFKASAKNLIHYRALRMQDIRQLQKALGSLGLSRLAKAEGHVMASLYITKALLSALSADEPVQYPEVMLDIPTGRKHSKENAQVLLGTPSSDRSTRIMVTLPSEAAENYQLVHEMIESGMNCARINCAHDSPSVWKLMIEHVRVASQKLRCHCKIAMDLGGPKIRTGALKPGPQVIKLRPPKDHYGMVIKPLPVWLGPEPHPTQPIKCIPVDLEPLLDLKLGDVLYFKDARSKKRQFVVREITAQGCLVECHQTLFLETGIYLYKDPKRQSDPIRIGTLPALEIPIYLNIGDELRLHASSEAGEGAQYDEDDQLTQIAHISCTAPALFQQVKAGEPILFDDGKIEGIIRSVSEEELIVQVIHTPEGGAKLRADKGINLPISKLKISGLTEKDKEDLKFVAEYADVVNVSFVNQVSDIQELLAELDKLDARGRLGIILKIETQSGFNNLTEILLEAMQVYPLGVMIARGDLAIETGWDNIGRVQKEILSMCQAGHITDIWATQVLENLAKRGIPSRAEITDAAMAQRADCVMLNKGAYIKEAIKLLDTILKDLEPYQEKNAPLLPALSVLGGQRS